VSVDPSGSRRVDLGPLFVRLSVKLSGAFDARWRRSYETIAAGAERFSRYRLDPAEAVVQFTCRSTDGAAEIQNLIERLGLLLELANLHATLQAASEKQQSA
jgi:hypothetical protein